MNIYFSGIGGSGIGPLAEMAIDAGYTVTGSDLEDSPMAKQLLEKGVKISFNQDGSFLEETHNNQPVDWLIYTAALRPDHPELIKAKDLGIKVSKRDELINHLASTHDLKLVGVAGTHGKTTTTAMLVWAMQQLKIPISYFIGTTIGFGPSGYFDKNSQYLVYECDEYNRNFLHFKPYLAIITAIDYDHPDTYPTKQDYLDAFEQFINNCQTVIAWQDQHPEVLENVTNAKIIKIKQVNPDLKLAGLCNRRNASLAQMALKELGIKTSTDGILSSFPGTSRRFEKIASNLYSDYAHHPTEIQASLQIASELSNDIMVVYQPHQNIRQHEIKDQYTNQFNIANAVYWLPTYEPTARENDNLDVLTPAELTTKLDKKINLHFAELNDDLWQTIDNARKNGQLVLCIGAGSIDKWLRNHLN